jgi:hypothetical protein
MRTVTVLDQVEQNRLNSGQPLRIGKQTIMFSNGRRPLTRAHSRRQKHWTQRPENRSKVRAVLKKANGAKRKAS